MWHTDEIKGCCSIWNQPFLSFNVWNRRVLFINPQPLTICTLELFHVFYLRDNGSWFIWHKVLTEPNADLQRKGGLKLHLDMCRHIRPFVSVLTDGRVYIYRLVMLLSQGVISRKGVYIRLLVRRLSLNKRRMASLTSAAEDKAQYEIVGCWTNPWWRHQMETFSALLALCAGNSPGQNWIPHTKASDAELGCFLWSAHE